MWYSSLSDLSNSYDIISIVGDWPEFELTFSPLAQLEI